MLPGCIALTDGNLDALVAAKAPFAEAKTRRELYGQQTAGVWKRLVPDEDQTTDELTGQRAWRRRWAWRRARR